MSPSSPLSKNSVAVPGTATGVAVKPAKLPGYKHPLDPLTPEEVCMASRYAAVACDRIQITECSHGCTLLVP